MMSDDDTTYRIVSLKANDKNKIQSLIKKLASEERIGIDEHIYSNNRANDRWGINPFDIFGFIKQVFTNPVIKRKEIHKTEYFPERYLCESDINNIIYPCVIGINETEQGLIVVITILNQKKKRKI